MELIDDNVYEQAIGDNASPTSGILAESGRFRASDPGRFDHEIEIIARRESKGGRRMSSTKKKSNQKHFEESKEEGGEDELDQEEQFYYDEETGE